MRVYVPVDVTNEELECLLDELQGEDVHLFPTENEYITIEQDEQC